MAPLPAGARLSSHGPPADQPQSPHCTASRPEARGYSRTTDKLIESKRQEVLRIAVRHGVGRVRVFGSRVRGVAGDSSDIDLLIDVTGPTTPWFPGGLVAELEKLLGCRVDVVEERSINPRVRTGILREARPL